MSIVPFFYQHFHDLSGKLAAAGRMHVYVAGSTIHKAIWTDVAMSVPRDNPMPLDGNGVVPQWFVGDGMVDIKVYTSTGSLIFTALNVSGAAASGQLPWPTPTTGFLHFDEAAGTYSWRNTENDHKVKMSAGDVATFLQEKFLSNSILRWDVVEIDPGVYGMQILLRQEELDFVRSVTAGFDADLSTAFNVSSAPVADTGTIQIEGVSSSAGQVLATPAGVAGKPRMRQLVATDLPDLSGKYLPLAGGSMAQNAQIQFPGQQNVGGFYGMYWQAPDCWSRISHWGGIWAPSLKPGERRGGLNFAPDSYGASIVLRSPEGQQGVSIYTHQTGGYSLYSWMPNGDARVALGVNPSGYGEAYFENSSSQTTVQITGNDGAIRAKSIFTGTGQWTQVERITPEGVASFGSVRTGPDQYSMVERINGLGDGFFRNISIASLSNGSFLRVTTDGGLLGDSALSEDAVSVKSAKPLTLNGATRPAWGESFAKTLQAGDATALVTYDDGAYDSQEIWVNCFFDGGYKAINSRPTSFPARLSVGSGAIALESSVTPPTAGAPITDMTTKWSVSRFGQTSQWAYELVTSGRYVKITGDTIIGPSATAKASLLSGVTTGFATVTDPANRWNAVRAKSRTELLGVISSAANQALTFELYRNGVVSATLTVPGRTYGTNTPWRLVIKQTVRVAGSSGTVRVLMRFYATADNANNTASCYTIDATLTGIDLTAAHTWDVVCAIPNDASNQITCQDAEKIG